MVNLKMLNQVKLRYWSVASCTYERLLQEMDVWRTDGKHHLACFCDANGLAHGWRDADLQKAYQKSDAVLADGTVTKVLARILGGSLPDRVIGPYLFPKAMAYGVPRGWRHYFYGAGPGTAEKLAERMREQFPGVQIVGTFSPPFGQLSTEEWARERKMIEVAKPDFLWVALGSPKQEKWCADHLGEINVSTLLPVGAVFDFYTGTVPQTPDWVHAIGGCWLWRLLTGGSRTFKRNAWCIPRALWILISEFCRIQIFRRSIR